MALSVRWLTRTVVRTIRTITAFNDLDPAIFLVFLNLILGALHLGVLLRIVGEIIVLGRFSI